MSITTSKITKENFFFEGNKVSSVLETEYERIQLYNAFLDGFARLTYQSIYVVDYWKKNFLYVSENPLFLCGLSSDEVRSQGYDFFINVCDPDELTSLVKINEAIFRFYNSLDISEKTSYSTSFNFHIKDIMTGKKHLIHHKLSPLCLTGQGEIWLALCSVSLASDDSVFQARIVCENSPKVWNYRSDSQFWDEGQEEELTDIEKEIVLLSNRGMRINEIAESLCKSVDTVKGYRRLLFNKLEVSNISEAIACAKSRRLL